MPISNDYNLIQDGTNFTISSSQLPSRITGGKITSETYIVAENEVTSPSPVINAVDIDWNGAVVNNETINTSGALLNVISDAVSDIAALKADGSAIGTGVQGMQGMTGKQGIQGICGLQGAAGSGTGAGLQGIQGIQGKTGTGLQGIEGSPGDQGPQGATGIQGAAGSGSGSDVQGTQGLQGAAGSSDGLSGSGTAGVVTYWSADKVLAAATGITYSNGALYESSDERIKKNIAPMSEEAYAKVLANVLTKEYDMKDTGEHKIGFIAQELLKVIPTAVHYDEAADKYSVHYTEALAAYCGALHTKVLELEARLAALEK